MRRMGLTTCDEGMALTNVTASAQLYRGLLWANSQSTMPPHPVLLQPLAVGGVNQVPGVSRQFCIVLDRNCCGSCVRHVTLAEFRSLLFDDRVCGVNSECSCGRDVVGTAFLQRVSIACYAERCISHDRFCLTVRPSDRLTV